MAEPDWDTQAVLARQRMAQVDAMPPDVRELIHEFNVNPVAQLFEMGMFDVKSIRAVLECRNANGDDAARVLFQSLMQTRRS